MAMSFWLENGTDPSHARHTLIDLGDINKTVVQEAADQLREHLGRQNFQAPHWPYLTVRLPPRKREEILKRFPQIREGAATLCWCTHSWDHS